MRNSPHSVSLGTFGLAFAIVLSPAFLRGDGGFEYSCNPPPGDNRLSELAVIAEGLDQIAFDNVQQTYDEIWLPARVESALVRAIPLDLGARVTVRVYNELGITQTMAAVVGGGEVDTPLSPGINSIEVVVVPPYAQPGSSNYYTVSLGVGCSDCSDGNECTTDTCDPVLEVCSDHTRLPNGTPCDFSEGVPGVCVYHYGVDTVCESACTGATCEEDFNDCTSDSCNPWNGDCLPVANGTACAGGTCFAGTCDVTETVLPCTGQAVMNAARAGGGPYSFDCDGPTTVVTAPDIPIYEDLILDGGGLLTIDGGIRFPSWDPEPPREVELRDLTITGHFGVYAGVVSVTESRILGDIINRNYSTLAIANSTLRGGIRNMATMTITGSVVSGGSGDGIVSSDAGNVVGPATLELTNSTVSGNAEDGIEADGILVLSHTTVFGNGANGINGIYGSRFSPLTMTVGSSIIAGDCTGAIALTSQGYNIESTGVTCGLDQPTDLSAVADLNLGPLEDNGGATDTHALLPGSVAIDWIPLADCLDADGAPLNEDQRGVARPQGSACDVGAFELEQ